VLNICRGGSTRYGHIGALAVTSGMPWPTLNSVAYLSATAVALTPAASDVVRVEEDWELNVTQPDIDLAAPQVGTVMAPCSDWSDLYATFLINHRLDPDYDPGGMELELYQQDVLIDWVDRRHRTLNTSGEQVTWTQRMHLQGDQLSFQIRNGNSATWGNFGGGGFSITLTTSLTDLNGYSSKVSIDNSGVTYASHRVASLVLKSVRGYSADGTLVFEEPDPVIVFEPADLDDH
jgi:hypothetical protein